MGIHEDIEAILLGDPENVDCVLNPLLIVFPGPGSLDGFPGEDIANGVVAEAF